MSSILKIIFLLSLVSCASTYKDFKVKNVKDDEAVAIGRVKVIYNNKDFTKNCSVCVAPEKKSCGVLTQLTENGLVFTNLKKGKATISRIQCKDVSVHHYDIKQADFFLEDEATYFGDVQLTWQTKGGFKASSMFGLIGALVDQSSNDGQLKMSVSPKGFKEVSHAYKKHIGNQSIKIKKNIVKAGL